MKSTTQSRLAGIAGISTVLLGSSLALADVSIQTFAARFATQTSNTGANPVYVVRYDEILNFNPAVPDDFTASIIRPSGALDPLVSNGNGIGWSHFQSASNITTEATLQPTGTYTFNISGGMIGDGSASMVRPATPWPNVPSMLNFDAVTSANPAAAFIVNFSSFVVDPALNSAAIYISLNNTTAGSFVLDTVLLSSDTSFTIPGSSLVAGDTYSLRLQFMGYDFPAVFDASGSLADASASSYRFSITDVTFTVVPTPGAAAVLGLAGLMAAKRRRRA